MLNVYPPSSNWQLNVHSIVVINIIMLRKEYSQIVYLLGTFRMKYKQFTYMTIVDFMILKI